MKTALLCAVVITIAAACRDEFHQLTPGTDPPLVTGTKPTCQAPLIEKNILGTWHFEFEGRTGLITFNIDKKVSDPDSLVSNHIDGYPDPVLYKEFSVETDSNGIYSEFGEMLWVRSYAKSRMGVTRYAQGNYYKVLVNECDRVELKVPKYPNKIVLTR